MSFRIEQKLFIKKNNYLYFYNYLKINNARQKFETRLINSIYFDNLYFQMHQEGEEGVVPRKKIRIRNYNHNNVFYLEKKISSAEGRFKTSKQLKDTEYYLNNGIYDSAYGVCKPKIQVSYTRSYVTLYGFNITIDKNISYKKFYNENKNTFVKYDNDIVVELKTNDLSKFKNIELLFPFKTIRFSKYSRGISLLYN